MKRIGIVMALLLLISGFAPVSALGQESGPQGARGDEFQLCTCLGVPTDTEALAAGIRKSVPGVEVRLAPREVGGRRVCDVFVRHPEMTPSELCHALGRASCDAAKRNCPRDGAPQ